MVVKNCEVVILLDFLDSVMLIWIPVTEEGRSQARLGVVVGRCDDSATSLARGKANLEYT